MAQLRDAVTNMQQLVSELSERLWDKATDNERHFPTQDFHPTTEVILPAVPESDRATTNYTPAYVDNKNGILDVEGYVPKEAILDTGATKVMLSRTFAAAMQIHAANLNRGTEYVTESGAIEMPLGISKSKVKFTMARGTPQMCNILLFVTVVETTAYDVLLGMEFITAMGGAYDAYTEIFKYR